MVTLNDGVRQISKLADEKGWGEDIATKIYYGMMEFAEAGDIWKHRDDVTYLLSIGVDPNKVPDAIAEELIDVILYALHGLHCIGFHDPDWMFDYKMRKNQGRNRVYADDVRLSTPKVRENE